MRNALIELERRKVFVVICQTWVGTPYHLRARIKGAGADCSTWICESLIEAGLATHEQLYNGLNIAKPDWWVHTTDEIYRRRVMRHAAFVMTAICSRSTNSLPGCILLQRAARSKIFNHAAVVVEWPLIIHGIQPVVQTANVTGDPMWSFKQVEIFDPFAAPGADTPSLAPEVLPRVV